MATNYLVKTAGAFNELLRQGALHTNVVLGGTSGGSICAFALAIGISPRDMLEQTKEMSAVEANNTFGPWWRVNSYVRKRLLYLADSVSPQAFERASGRAFLCVAETPLSCGDGHTKPERLSQGRSGQQSWMPVRKRLVSSFRSNEHLVDCVIASSHIPLYSAPPTELLYCLDGRLALDGGVVDQCPDVPSPMDSQGKRDGEAVFGTEGAPMAPLARDRSVAVGGVPMPDPSSPAWANLPRGTRSTEESARSGMLGHPLAEAVDLAQARLARAAAVAAQGGLPVPLALEHGAAGTQQAVEGVSANADPGAVARQEGTGRGGGGGTETETVCLNSWGYTVPPHPHPTEPLPLKGDTSGSALPPRPHSRYLFEDRTYKVSPIADSWFFGTHDVRPELPPSRAARLAMWTQMLDRALHPRADPAAIEAQFQAGAWDAGEFLLRSESKEQLDGDRGPIGTEGSAASDTSSVKKTSQSRS